MFGLSQDTTNKLKQLFSDNPKIDCVILYGSRAIGKYKEGSDIDLSIKGENISLDDLFTINIKAEDLLLPYKLDLNIYNNIKNKDLIDHINQIGKIIYIKK